MRIIDDFHTARNELSRRASGIADNNELEQSVRQWVEDVRIRGDAAVIEYTEKFDGVRLTKLEVDKREVQRARAAVEPELLSALELAAERIASYHRKQKETLLRECRDSLGWLVRPLKRVGINAPGFQAPLPSTVLMTAVPARVAGVEEIFLVTPPGRDGAVSPVTLAAASVAGVDRVFSVGGAQAIAALAYGTESIPAVDMVCGPGNIYTTLAKKVVYGTVGVDGLYGPSEVIIITDGSADAGYGAADLLAQAEHGQASAILITTSRRLAEKVNEEIERQLEGLSRKSAMRESLDNRGLIAVVEDVEKAIDLANVYAPEHLCLVVGDAARYVEKIENAGCVFVGEDSLEALVDYVAGPSHVLPTGGTARFGSPLSVLDFIKTVNLVNTSRDDIKRLGKAASIIARAEGLDAHARAVEKRLEKMEGTA